MQEIKVINRLGYNIKEQLIVLQQNQAKSSIKRLIYNMEQKELSSLFNKYYAGEKSIEFVLQKLRGFGASQMECTKTLVFELKISLSEADTIVVNSKAWMDVRDHVIRFRDNMFE
jgi:hypothetical protein